MMALGCGSKESAEVMPRKVESSQNMSKDEDTCREIINAYYSQQINFDNSKIRDLNSHIVSLADVANNVFTRNNKDDSYISRFMLDRTTDRTCLRDSIRHEFLMGMYYYPSKYASKEYMHLFSREEGNEIAGEYINLYSMTKIDVQSDDNINNKNEIAEAFGFLVQNPQPDEIYSFKIRVEHIDFESINNEIAKRIRDVLIKDPKIIFTNERIKTGKTQAPTRLDELFGCVDFSKDRPYIVNKIKQVFIEVLKENERNPKMIHNDFNAIMYGKPLLEGGSKVFLVARSLAVDTYIWGGARDILGEYHQLRKEKPYGLKFSVLDTQFTDNKMCEFKISIYNDTAKEITFNLTGFKIMDEYGRYIREGSLNVPNDAKHNPRQRYSKKGSAYLSLPKDEYDKFTDEELDMLLGDIPIPSQKRLEITMYMPETKESLDKCWLTYGYMGKDDYWEIKLSEVIK